MTAVLELVTPVSVASSVLLGAMIGALYGYEIAPTIRPRFPVSLWTVGLAFVVMLAVVAALSSVPGTPAFAIGRAILWTVVCGSIPGGRWLRGAWQRRF